MRHNISLDISYKLSGMLQSEAAAFVQGSW